ncbi:RNA-directed DNA polymerase-like protein [Gossypium australe]|uniref:RNA-directed DNA polymerase-like protein n=1 Tax=Gossypium australe TaxID=47621 RepID=A0A5B6V9L2_9ROSI|nr:RNA-directed DNA polymerase-like protein [Gossypium australe]
MKKKDGNLRMCINYRQLNKLTVKKQLPFCHELMTCSTSCELKVKESYVLKTIFHTSYGHYDFLVMPFGLTNAPVVFM